MTDQVKASKDNFELYQLVSEEKMRFALNSAIYQMSLSKPFLSSIMQSLNVHFSPLVPRAGIRFDNDHKCFEMLIHPYYFCEILSDAERVAVLDHEISHVTHKHLIRIPFIKLDKQMRPIMNVAADMAINQYIKNLPEGCKLCPPAEEMAKGKRCENKKCPGHCILLKNYYEEDKSGKKIPWKENMTTEYYFEKLLERIQEGKDGEGDGEGKSGKGIPDEFDSHDWSEGAEEKDVLDSTEDIVKRAMIKRGLGFDQLDKHIQELLQHIEARKAELNYRALILAAIKRHASGHERKSTWSRKNKRYGNKAPGTRVGDLPKIQFHIDTSGSISIEEANEFLGICDEFLRVGARKSQLNLFHTKQYYCETYRLGDRLDRNRVQNGGTDLEESMVHIMKTNPDLAVILTDGCYSDVGMEAKMKAGQKFPQCVFIISKEGAEDHPLKRFGSTVKIPK